MTDSTKKVVSGPGSSGDDRQESSDADSTQKVRAISDLPKMPDPASRRFAVLQALRNGEAITTVDALRRGLGWRTSADIHALRQKGWPIITTMIRLSNSSQPIARYHLPAKWK